MKSLQLLFFLGLLSASGIQVWAQENSTNSMELVSVVRSMQSRMQPGGFVFLTVRVRNHSENTEEAAIVLDTSIQSQRATRHIQLAPQSSEAVPLQVRLPPRLPVSGKVDVHCKLYGLSGEPPVILQWQGRPQQQTVTFQAERLTSLAGLALERDKRRQPYWHWPPLPPHASYELSVASLVDAGKTQDAVQFDVVPPPLESTMWQEMASVVIADARLFNDLAVMESLKRYVADGGQLWIMLDRVPCAAIRPLLGNGQSCEVVDITEVTEFTLETTDSSQSLLAVDRSVSLYEPAKLKRVVQTGGSVTHRIDQWPVAIWMDVGLGSILLTTLDSSAWIEPRGSRAGIDPRADAPFRTRAWANELAQRIHFDDSQPTDSAELSGYPFQLIGNPVLPRRIVMTALGLFCCLCAGTGFLLYAGNRNALLIYLLTPILAGICATFLMGFAQRVRKDIPESIAKLQTVLVTDDGNTASITEVGVVYLERPKEMSLQWSGDGYATIGSEVTAGILSKEQNDFQQWSLSNETWPSGAWRYTTQTYQPTDGLVAVAKLNDSGVEIQVPQSLTGIEDVVFEYVVGDPLICTASSDGFSCDGSLPASAERWIDSSLLTSEQQRRVGVYREQFKRGLNTDVRPRLLYGWTELWPDGPSWSAPLKQTGSALVAMPVRIQRPDSGSQVYIPHGLVRLRTNPDVSAPTTAYRNRLGRWNAEFTMPVNAAMQFVLPSELMPLTVSEIEIELDAKAPHRVVRLLAGTSSADGYEIVSLQSPSIPWKATVTDPSVLQEVSDGTLDILVEVSERTDIENPSNARNVVSWEIEYLRASFRGTIGGNEHSVSPRSE